MVDYERSFRGPMVHATAAIRPQAPADYAAWVAGRGWNVVYFKTMTEFNAKADRPPPRGAYLERAKDAAYFRQFAEVAGRFEIEAIPYVFVIPWNARAQGANFGKQVLDFGAVWAMANVERTFETASKTLRERGSNEWLEGFWSTVGHGRVSLILSTFAQSRLHPSFPWSIWLAGCQVFSGQCYSSHPSRQVRESVDLAAEFGVECWPCFRAYVGDGFDDRGRILATTEEAMAEARRLGVRSWMFWQQKAIQRWPEMEALIRE